MDTRQLLHDTFQAHEAHAPDTETAWRRLNAELAHSGTRAPYRLRASAAGLVAAASVMAVVSAGVVVADRHQGDSNRSTTRTATTISSGVDVSPAPIVVPNYLTIGPGWLPPGKVVQTSVSTGSSQARDYEIGPLATMYNLTVNLRTGSLATSYRYGGVKRDLTINGQHAREWTGANPASGAVTLRYHLEVQRPSGQVLWIDLNSPLYSPTQSRTQLGTYGRHVARAMRYNRHDLLHPQFQLRYLPPGTHVSALRTGRDGQTTYQLTTTTRQTSNGATVFASNGPYRTTHPGRAVQGHPSTTFTGPLFTSDPDTGTLTKTTRSVLVIERALPGQDIVLISGQGARTLTQLYKIADRLDLPH